MKILFTGGIGDIMALEACISDIDRLSITEIYFASRAEKKARELFDAVKKDAYPRLEKYVTVWDDFSTIFAFLRKEQITQHGEQFYSMLSDVEDYSIAVRFAGMRYGMFPYNGSSFLRCKLTDTAPKFPFPYYIIQPYTANDTRLAGRDYDEYDWKNTKTFLQKNRLKGVILGNSKDYTTMAGVAQSEYYFPNNDDTFINLNNKTSLIESIEVMKGARGYIGVDSCLSVLATKLYQPEHIKVKSISRHLHRWRDVYYAPLKHFNFISSYINI